MESQVLLPIIISDSLCKLGQFPRPCRPSISFSAKGLNHSCPARYPGCLEDAIE